MRSLGPVTWVWFLPKHFSPPPPSFSSLPTIGVSYLQKLFCHVVELWVGPCELQKKRDVIRGLGKVRTSPATRDEKPSSTQDTVHCGPGECIILFKVPTPRRDKDKFHFSLFRKVQAEGTKGESCQAWASWKHRPGSQCQGKDPPTRPDRLFAGQGGEDRNIGQ